MPFIIVRLASEGTPVRQFEIALRSLQSLDRRLFVDREHDRVLGRGHIEADDLGRFRHELRIVALTPGFTARKVDLLGAKEPPDILLMHVAERPGNERTRPVGVTRGRFRVEKRQNAGPVSGPYFGAAPRLPVSSKPARRSRA